MIVKKIIKTLGGDDEGHISEINPKIRITNALGNEMGFKFVLL